jgi:LacI family transcriptional regulator
VKKIPYSGRPDRDIKTSASTALPTLREVALRAEVSVTTVSNVVNKKFELMAPDTRSRVEAAIRELKYRVNATGRSLRSSANMGIAFIVLDECDSFLRDPFSAEIVSGLTNSLAEKYLKLSIQRIDPNKLEDSPLFSTLDAAGLCINLQGSRSQRRKALNRISTLSLPIALIEDDPAHGISDLCNIRQDDYGGGNMLARHLRKRGAKSILFVRQKVSWSSIDGRDAGISAVFGAERGLTMQRLEVDHMQPLAQIERDLPRYIDEHGTPDAIMGANDQIAAACIKVLLQRGLNVPKDIAVTGFNGFEVFDLLPYRITTIRSAAYELGFRAGQELAERLRFGAFRSSEIALSVSLRLGETT